jgi:outer membrane protein assembly factor BamB
MTERFFLFAGSALSKAYLLILAASILWASFPCYAGDWPHWRGPSLNGASEEANLPDKWDTKKNVLWAVPMPGVSAATPIVSGKRVFIQSMNRAKNKVVGFCLNGDTGEMVWREELAEVPKNPPNNTMATCSPVTDGEIVVFMTGTSDISAFKVTGEKLWSQNLASKAGPIDMKYGYSASPLLHNSMVYLSVLREEEESDEKSYLICLDARSGEKVWKVNRWSDATGESRDSYASPVLFGASEMAAIVTLGANYLTGHDAVTGTETWRCAYNPQLSPRWRITATPITVGKSVIAIQPPDRRAGCDAFSFAPTEKSRMKYSEATWTFFEGKVIDVPSPLYYKGRLYLLSDRNKAVTCLAPDTGEMIWEGALGGRVPFYSSPTAADGKIFCMNRDGEIFVLSAGDEFKVLSHIEMDGERCDSSIAIADSKLFIRTTKKLYCIKEVDGADKSND